MSIFNMSAPSAFVPNKTAVVLLDVYNEFLHPEGKINPYVSESMAETNTIHHLKDLVHVARASHIPVYYALHQTWQPGNYQGWKHMNATTTGFGESGAIADGSWGAEIYPGLEPDVIGNNDVVVSKHWNSR